MPFLSLSELDRQNPETDALMRHWTMLANGTRQPDPACSAPVWNLAYHEVFNPERRIFYLSSDTSLLLLSEMPPSEDGVILTPLEDSWMFGRPLLGFYAAELLEEALDIFAAEYKRKLRGLVLSGIVRRTPEATKLLVLHGRNYNFFKYQTTTQCYASLHGGMDGWLSRRSANHRAKLKKAARKARDAGIIFERHKPRTAKEAANIYARMLAVELQSWKGIEKCGMAESPSREFYDCLIRRHALKNSCYVIFARHGDRDIGFIYGGASGTFYRGQQFSYTREYAPYSIGNLMQLEKVGWLCEECFTRYDMGPITGPRMEYKQHWTEGRVVSETWVMRPV